MEKRLFKSIDLLKFISAIAVICLHTRPFIDTEFEYYANTFFVMAVPIFFCTSSFFFHSKEDASLYRYIKRLLLLYFIWFIIELPYVINKFDFCSFSGLKFFIWSLFFQNTFWASWFLMALIIAMLIVVPINRKGHSTLLYVIGAISFLLSLFASMYNGLIPNVFDATYCKYFKSFLYYISASQSFILAIPYCILGIKLVNLDLGLTLKNELLILLLLAILATIESYICVPIYSSHNASLLIIPVVFMVVHMCLKYEINIRPEIVVFLRKSSILLYLTHSIVEYFFREYAGLDYGIVLTVITIILSLILSFLIVFLSNYIKPLKFLY